MVMKKAIHYISFVFYVLIGIYILVSLPILFGYKPLVVLSGSMKPQFQTGSLIYYQDYDGQVLKIGDIITYKDVNNNIVSHRIVKVNKDNYILRGDNNNTNDLNPVTKDQIIGIDSNVSIRLVGYYVYFVNKYLVSLLIVTIMVLVAEFVLSNMKIEPKGGKSNEEII